eukprot:14219330-Ditylum_brightwellii.AAC.1
MQTGQAYTITEDEWFEFDIAMNPFTSDDIDGIEPVDFWLWFYRPEAGVDIDLDHVTVIPAVLDTVDGTLNTCNGDDLIIGNGDIEVNGKSPWPFRSLHKSNYLSVVTEDGNSYLQNERFDNRWSVWYRVPAAGCLVSEAIYEISFRFRIHSEVLALLRARWSYKRSTDNVWIRGSPMN